MKKYTFKVYPAGMGRRAYRVIEVPGTDTLDSLCSFILSSFDFIQEHLYEFNMDNKMYGSALSYQCEPERGAPSTRVSIDKLNLVKGQTFSLHYDFGDDWMFAIHVQKIEEASGKVKRAVVSSKGKVEQYPDWDDEDEEEWDEDDEE